MTRLPARSITRRAIAGLLATPALLPSARAQAWPAGPIRIVVPVPPGGSIDAVARLAQPGLQQALGVPVVIENRGGGAGSIGTAAVSRAAPDGQTWLITFDWHPMMNALIPNLPFDIQRDFVPVMLIGSVPYLVVAKPEKPFRGPADIVAAARAKPEAVTFASSGSGTLGHLAMTLFQARADIRLTHVAYRGGGPALADTLSGQVDMMIASAALLAPQVSGGALRAVAQTGAARLPLLPDLPTMAEAGFPDVVADAWWGFFAPTGTPAPVVARFADALRVAFAEPRVIQQMTGPQQARMLMQDGAQLAAFVTREAGTWGRVIRDNNIVAD